ncbi:MAG: hypothetical protein MI807_22920 [Verrucomicrobiales bacterium]|nr:hypothetical protein [Verrucomicrobiales bacterium]
MDLLDSEPWSWQLFQSGSDLYLEVLCSHSAADYLFAIQLDSFERARFKESGREYLNHLAHEIHYSAPGVKGSRSPYLERRVSDEVAKKIRSAAN